MDEIKPDLQLESQKLPEKSESDFCAWNNKKIQINKKEIVPPFNQREIWWCSIGLNVGYEEDGKNDEFERPVLVLRKFSADVFIGLPLTSTVKHNDFYFPYSLYEEKQGAIMLSHPRLLSAKRLNRKLSRIGRGIFRELAGEYLKLYS